jgi:hypothetical protein
MDRLEDRPSLGLGGRESRLLQFVVAAVLTGPVALLAVVFVLKLTDSNQVVSDGETMTAVFIGVAVVCLFMSFVVPRMVERQAASRLAREGTPAPADETRLFAVYRLRTLLAVGLLEGGAFLVVLGYLLWAAPVSLVLVALLALAAAHHFPTSAKAARWFHEQRGAVVRNDRGVS